MPERPLDTDGDRVPIRHAGRGALLSALSAVAVVLLAAVVYLVVAAPGMAQTVATGGEAVIDINAPVKSNEQCVPCHATIAEAQYPGLIFSHGSHLLIACDACHWQPPHKAGKTVRPNMDSCFNCHGLRHGPKSEVARGECGACHEPSFTLRPASHTKKWAATTHVPPAKANVNRCLMCHVPEQDCDECHVKEGVAKDVVPRRYQPLVVIAPAETSVTVAPEEPVTMGQCVNCHPDLDSFTPGKVIFEHGTHFDPAGERGQPYECVSCHPAFAHSPDVTQRPDMPTCYQCHGLVHSTSGSVATGKCADCHPPSFELKPDDHTAEFEKSGHKKVSNEDPAYCSMCHESSFCIKCHQGVPAKPGDPRGPKVIPADHKTKSFMQQHGKDYLAQRGACGSCHVSKQCEACHKTTMPHPADWTSQHGLNEGLDTSDCNVCHTDRKSCQACHHDPLKGAELLKKNCIRCHDEMRASDPTTIKNKGLAEHAVHFEVYKSKGKPYVCEDCHIGFGISRPGHAATDLTGGHDLQLCYQCHGAGDYRNIEIAPYPGNSLCLRCHKDLNL